MALVKASTGSDIPCPVGDDPHAEVVAEVQPGGVHNPVLDDQAFRLQEKEANIGVPGAFRLCEIQGTIG